MNVVNKLAIEIINDYINYLEFIFEREKYEYTLEQKSYSMWIANETIKVVRFNPNTPPLMTIERFRNKIEEYSHMNKKSDFIFSTALETIDNIIDVLISS